MLDLSRLTVEEASALEQVALAAKLTLGAQHDEANARFRKAPANSEWEAQALAECDRYQRLEGYASRLYFAASRRSRQADRERCQAIRSIEAFAQTIVRLWGAAMRKVA